MLDELVQKNERRLLRFLKEKSQDKLDRILNHETRRLPHLDKGPFVSLAYIHENYMEKHFEGYYLRPASTTTSEAKFVNYLDGENGDIGALRKMVMNLPRQSGLVRRDPSQFEIDINTFFPMTEMTDNFGQCYPLISVVSISAGENYPGNSKGNSIRARRDVAILGGKVLCSGLNPPINLVSSERLFKPVFPFWSNANFHYSNSLDKSRDLRFHNVSFLNGLLGSIGMRALD